jgi:hypothetical protein
VWQEQAPVSEAQTDWLLGTLVFSTMWFLGYLGQRAPMGSRGRIRVSRLVAILVGYPSATTASVSNTGWQIMALAMLLVNSGLALFVPIHEDRIGLLAILLAVLGLTDAVFVTAFRNRDDR